MSNYIVASVSRGNRRHRSQYKIRITVALVFRRVADRKRRDGALLNRLKLRVLAGIYVQGKSERSTPCAISVATDARMIHFVLLPTCPLSSVRCIFRNWATTASPMPN